jgi:hypothetical protein
LAEVVVVVVVVAVVEKEAQVPVAEMDDRTGVAKVAVLVYRLEEEVVEANKSAVEEEEQSDQLACNPADNS